MGKLLIYWETPCHQACPSLPIACALAENACSQSVQPRLLHPPGKELCFWAAPMFYTISKGTTTFLIHFSWCIISTQQNNLLLTCTFVTFPFPTLVIHFSWLLTITSADVHMTCNQSILRGSVFAVYPSSHARVITFNSILRATILHFPVKFSKWLEVYLCSWSVEGLNTPLSSAPICMFCCQLVLLYILVQIIYL